MAVFWTTMDVLRTAMVLIGATTAVGATIVLPGPAVYVPTPLHGSFMSHHRWSYSHYGPSKSHRVLARATMDVPCSTMNVPGPPIPFHGPLW